MKKIKWTNKKMIYFMILLGVVLYLGQVVFSVTSESNEEKLAILGFHNVVMDDEKREYYANNMWVDGLSSFEEKIKYLYDEGYESLSLDEAYDWIHGNSEIKEKSVVLTFDDGYYASSYLIEPILAKYGFQATTFVIGGSIAGEHIWDASKLQFMNLEDMKKQDVMKYASHTYDMHGKQGNEFLLDLRSKEEMQNDIDIQKELVDTTYLAYPYGYYNERMIEVLRENDVKLAFGFNEDRKATKKDNVYKIPRFSVNAFTSIETFRAMLDS